MPKTAKRPRSAVPIRSLVLTGRRTGRRFDVFVNGRCIPLTGEAIGALIKLIVGRAGDGSGLAPLSCNQAYRLRRAFDQALGPGAGAAAILNGVGEEYRLAIRAADFKSIVAVTPCFFELSTHGVLDDDQASRIKRVCRRCGKAEAAVLFDH